MSEGGQSDSRLADFQAKLLQRGQPPRSDPAEEHMNNVMRLVLRWAVALVLIAGASLWLGGLMLSVIVVAGVTLCALAVPVSIGRQRSFRTHPSS